MPPFSLTGGEGKGPAWLYLCSNFDLLGQKGDEAKAAGFNGDLIHRIATAVGQQHQVRPVEKLPSYEVPPKGEEAFVDKRKYKMLNPGIPAIVDDKPYRVRIYSYTKEKSPAQISLIYVLPDNIVQAAGLDRAIDLSLETLVVTQDKPTPAPAKGGKGKAPRERKVFDLSAWLRGSAAATRCRGASCQLAGEFGESRQSWQLRPRFVNAAFSAHALGAPVRIADPKPPDPAPRPGSRHGNGHRRGERDRLGNLCQARRHRQGRRRFPRDPGRLGRRRPDLPFGLALRRRARGDAAPGGGPLCLSARSLRAAGRLSLRLDRFPVQPPCVDRRAHGDFRGDPL